MKEIGPPQSFDISEMSGEPLNQPSQRYPRATLVNFGRSAMLYEVFHCEEVGHPKPMLDIEPSSFRGLEMVTFILKINSLVESQDTEDTVFITGGWMVSISSPNGLLLTQELFLMCSRDHIVPGIDSGLLPTKPLLQHLEPFLFPPSVQML